MSPWYERTRGTSESNPPPVTTSPNNYPPHQQAMETEQLALDPATVVEGCRAILGDHTKGFYLVATADGETDVIGQLMITYECALGTRLSAHSPSDSLTRAIRFVRSQVVRLEEQADMVDPKRLRRAGKALEGHLQGALPARAGTVRGRGRCRPPSLRRHDQPQSPSGVPGPRHD